MACQVPHALEYIWVAGFPSLADPFLVVVAVKAALDQALLSSGIKYS